MPKYIVATNSYRFKTGLHGWSDNIEDAKRFDRIEQAQNYINLYQADQQRDFQIIEEIEIGGELAHGSVPTTWETRAALDSMSADANTFNE